MWRWRASRSASLKTSVMRFLERDLENIIWDNIHYKEDIRKLIGKGLTCLYDLPTTVRARQLRIGNYGIADMVTLNRNSDNIYVTVYELKKDEINIDSLIQAARYSRGITKYLNARFEHWHLYVDIVLIGNKINQSDWVYLFNSFVNDVSIYTYDFDIDGLRFIEHHMNYSLVEEGFNG